MIGSRKRRNEETKKEGSARAQAETKKCSVRPRQHRVSLVCVADGIGCTEYASSLLSRYDLPVSMRLHYSTYHY